MSKEICAGKKTVESETSVWEVLRHPATEVSGIVNFLKCLEVKFRSFKAIFGLRLLG